MAELTLEQRVALLERQVAELRGTTREADRPTRTREQRIVGLEEATTELKRKQLAKWWERPPLPPEMLQAHETMTAYGRYFRKTGQEPPPDWKPGDPIPDPPEWRDSQS